MASPTNNTQKYLYRTKLTGKGKEERVSPANQPGTHEYAASPNARFARHVFSNLYTPYTEEFISLPDHKGLNGENKVNDAIVKADKATGTSFFKITTEEGVEMDGWMVKPSNFDS